MSRYREYSSPCDTQLHSNSLVAGSKMDTSHAGHYRTDPSVSSISPHYQHIPHGSYKSKDDSIAVDIYNHGPNLPRKSSQSGATDSFKGTEDVLKDTSMEILCFDLTSLPRGAQFLLCCGSVFFFYVIYGYFMELIFRLDGFRPFGWYLTLLQFAWYSIFGILESQIKQDFRRKAPLSTYAILAFLSVATIGLSNSSMGYLNFPTQQIFKSCKLIPVMIGGILIQGKRYGLLDVTACLSMCLGLAIFTIADSTVSPNFDTYGIFVIMLALCADAVIGNVQEKVMKQFNCSNIEMVLYSCSIGFVYIFVGLLLTGNLLPAIRFCSKHPTHTYGYAFIFSITGYLGLVSVLTLVKSFGALIAVTVTTCRKAITIILSFIFFTKPFTIHYVWSGFIVILGIMLNIYSKNRKNINLHWGSYIFNLFIGRKSHRQYMGLERVI